MKNKRNWNRHKTMTVLFLIFLLILLVIIVGGEYSREKAVTADFSRKNLAPCPRYPFGTDWMGRDMFLRTLCGLSLSIRIGLLTACISAGIAFFMGICASLGKAADGIIIGMIDAVMGIPHLLLLILISFAAGKGFPGVVAGISLTHWTSLARLLRGEVLQLNECSYIKISRKLGMGKLKAAFFHMTPHLLPQLLVGVVLEFPHAILHEASLTFLGFGLPMEQPAIGIILSESMKYLSSGKWWLSLFPGLMLVLVVLMFHQMGDMLDSLFIPEEIHQ